MKVVDRGRDFNTRNYFLFCIVVGIGLPSMSMREIVENIFIQL